MRRILIMTLVLGLAGASAAQARPGDRNRDYDRDHDGRDRGRSERSYDNGYRRYAPPPLPPQQQWRPGQRVSPSRGEVVDYRSHRLRRPPRGYDWVRSGDGYLLRDSASGMVTEVIPGR